MGSRVNLPPGFRFYPSDEELVVHFLHRKAALLPCHPDVIPDLDLYPYDPWQLDGKALSEGKQWYFYSRRTQNRISENGYWKPMAGRVEEPVLTSSSSSTTTDDDDDDNSNSKIVGMKKYYLFYKADHDQGQGIKTNWVMEEYRLSPQQQQQQQQHCSSNSSTSKTRGGRSSKQDYRKWVICRVYERNCDEDDSGTDQLSCLDEVFLSLDDLDEISLPN